MTTVDSRSCGSAQACDRSLLTGELAALQRDDLVHLEHVDLKGIDTPTALVTLARYR